MRSLVAFTVLAMLALSLSGCAVASVAGAAVDVGSTVVSTTADVAGDVVGATADTVTGSGDAKKDDDKND